MAYAEPARNEQAALRPAEDPGDRAQAFKCTFAAAPGRPRADLGVFQLGHRRACFEKVEHLRVVEDAFAIERKGAGRKAFKSRLPFRFQLAGALTFGAQVGPRQRVERGRDHQLQVALGQHRIAVFPVQHLALLGQAKRAVERVERLRVDGAMRGAAAAPHRAAAPVKQAQRDAGLVRDPVQRSMRAKNLPGARQHAAVLVGVGVAKHDLLHVAPARDQRAVFGVGPQRAAHFRCILQILDRLKQGDRHQAWIVVAATRIDAAETRQPQYREHILLCRRARNDIRADRLRHGTALDLRDRAKGVEHLQRLRAERPGHGTARTVAARDLVQRLRVNAGMLANVECMEVQAEGAYLQ